jgi:hypothetical protein
VLHPHIRDFLAGIPADLPLAAKVNALLVAPEGQRDWPHRFYTRERLFSVEARLGWCAPDLAPLPFLPSPAAPERPR